MPSSDILIVGGGLAGLFCALKLAPRRVTVVAAAPLGAGASSAWAQGGIAAAIGEGDTPEKHMQDTLVAGAGICDREIVLGMANEASARIDDLLAYGVPFDRDVEGRLAQSREAAHGERRIVRVRGDMAGKAIMQALIARVNATPSIEIIDDRTAEDLITHNGRAIGVMLRDVEGRREKLAAGAVILATGGVGHLYRVSTNPAEARGLGLAMAARAGAIIADAEFVQFHPTAIDIGRDPAPLATEALRGEGATLINRNGQRFMLDLHPDGELAPRDIVARGVFAEVQSGRGAFLDGRIHPGVRFGDDFPSVAEICLSAGIDPATDLIPVCPAEHYHMGGVWTDARGRTSLGGLWAIGEVASTGVHGANRLASNSLLEAVVFAARVAEDLAARDEQTFDIGPVESFLRSRVPQSPLLAQPHLVDRLRDTMSRDCGVLRDSAGLRRALGVIGAIEQEARDQLIKNMCAAALLIAAAALAREESRGGHFRTDFPDTDPGQARRSRLTLREARRIASGL
ncbi:MAG: L-aspartate oxidase [Hyphomicrobiales bacterium]|nr:L-aspartate oxidase [Hyphomicrobiales bacterium]